MSTFEADGIDYGVSVEDVSNVWMYAIILVLTIFIFFLFRGICAMWKETPHSESRTLTRTRYTGGRITTGPPDPQSCLSSDGPKYVDPLQRQEKAPLADSPLTPVDANTDRQTSGRSQSPGRTSKRSFD
ncbi:hypothetical protein AAHC03_026500 [Spirometra sp. Aus1]